MFERFFSFLAARKRKKAEKLRAKNFALRKSGKDPHKGWGKMIDSGLGGANQANPIDTRSFHIENQKNLKEDLEKKTN